MSKLKTELIVFAHGSSVESANQAVRDVARSMAASGGYPAEAAFLEGGTPDLITAVRAAAGRGTERVVVIPYFLTVGLHLKRDLPNLLQEAAEQHPSLRFEVTPPLDGHPALIDILLDRASAALNGHTD